MHNAFDAPQQQSLPPPDPRVVLRQAVRTWKNAGLLLLLAIALICLVAGLELRRRDRRRGRVRDAVRVHGPAAHPRRRRAHVRLLLPPVLPARLRRRRAAEAVVLPAGRRAARRERARRRGWGAATTAAPRRRTSRRPPSSSIGGPAAAGETRGRRVSFLSSSGVEDETTARPSKFTENTVNERLCSKPRLFAVFFAWPA